jgi:hypothetical protein
MQNDDTPGPAPVDPTNVGGGRDRPASEFDPIAVADKIAEHLAEADKAVAAHREHSMAAGALLLDVQENHPKHMEAICNRIRLGRSRRAELLMIAGGRKTLQESKAQNRARVQRHRTKKKAAAVPPPRPSESPLQRPVMDDPPQPANRGNDVDPDASADAMKMAHAAAETQIEPDTPKPTPKPGKSFKTSNVALAQFKVAVDHWLKQMSEDDTTEALAYAKTVGDRHIAKIREIAA